MSTEITTAVEIQECDLQLVVSEKTLGSLTTNAKQILGVVRAGIARYDIANYSESNIDLAKKDKALLNSAAKTLNARRIEIERELMLPFQEFKEAVSETVKLIADCSAKIDMVVKQSEEKAKQEKRETIRRYWDSKSYSLITFDKIFDSKWLNKTEPLKNVYSAIDAIVVKTNDDIATLEAIGENVDLLKSLYLDTLNINSTIQHANTLKQNSARAKAAEEAKQRVSAAPPTAAPPETKETQPAKIQPAQPEEKLLTRAFRVTTTRENIIALGDFMNERGIEFEKIEA
jgi:hypothetical protein